MISHWIENFTSTSVILGIVLTKTFVDLNRYFVKNKVNTIWAMIWDIQQCGILTSVESDKPAVPPFKLGNSKLCSVISLRAIEYSSD